MGMVLSRDWLFETFERRPRLIGIAFHTTAKAFAAYEGYWSGRQTTYLERLPTVQIEGELLPGGGCDLEITRGHSQVRIYVVGGKYNNHPWLDGAEVQRIQITPEHSTTAGEFFSIRTSGRHEF